MKTRQKFEAVAAALYGAALGGALLAVAFCSGIAHAQAGDIAGAGLITHAEGQVIATAVKDGKWLLLVAVLLTIVMRFVRGPLLSLLPAGKVKDALSSTFGGWLTNLTSSFGAGIVTGLVAGTPLDAITVINLAVGSFVVSLTAAGGHEMLKDAFAKGTTAAATVDSKAEALAAQPKP